MRFVKKMPAVPCNHEILNTERFLVLSLVPPPPLPPTSQHFISQVRPHPRSLNTLHCLTLPIFPPSSSTLALTWPLISPLSPVTPPAFLKVASNRTATTPFEGEPYPRTWFTFRRLPSSVFADLSDLIFLATACTAEVWVSRELAASRSKEGPFEGIFRKNVPMINILKDIINAPRRPYNRDRLEYSSLTPSNPTTSSPTC